MFGRRRPGAWIAAGDRARDRRDWHAAADSYAVALKLQPGNTAIWIQRGHALKEDGRLADAEQCYRQAIRLDPTQGEFHLQLGHVAKMRGEPGMAVAAYAEALRVDPDLVPARDELLQMGALEALPNASGGGLIRAREYVELQTSMARTVGALADWARVAPVPAGHYDAFRRLHPVPPPPKLVTRPVVVVIEGRETVPALVRRTLLSLVDQAGCGWQARLIAPAVEGHPVESLAHVDARIALVAPPTALDDLPADALIVFLEGGSVLDPQALAWLLFASDRTGAQVLYADHDTVLPHWRFGASYFSPRLYGAMDADFIEAVAEPPLMVAVVGDPTTSIDYGHPFDAEYRRALMLSLGAGRPVAHVPRILSSRAIMPPSALHGRDDLPTAEAMPRIVVAPADASSIGPLTVIIPTRDAAHLLVECVETLVARAARPDLLDICVVNNRSVEPATTVLFDRWRKAGRVRIVEFDEPFNWSRANNVAVASAPATHRLLFLNNDTAMLTQDWDAILYRLLDREDIGAVGARLLYPDGSVQHGGVVLGVGQGSPVHEGVGAPAEAAGPLGRWKIRRRVPAVTGAFLACRRDVYDEIGGFDEVRLPIGFNDIDFCLRLRAGGRHVLYEPEIELTHHESKTRGHNDTISKLLWDHDELETFAMRWGEAAYLDPGYNPQWAPTTRPFESFQEPPMSQILHCLDRDARARPWCLGD